MKISKKFNLCLCVIFNSVLLISFNTSNACAGWQSVLESKFDIVDTFDDLQDWKPLVVGGGAFSIQDYPTIFPQKTDGSPSIWQYYSFYGDVSNIKTPWIQNHGSGNVWRGSGKSLVIDYNQAFPTEILGPSRLGFKIGSTPSDGYHDEVYVFNMIKIQKDFFKITGATSFNYYSFLKILDISSGFKTVREWGTDAERAWLSSNCTSPYPTTQALNEYGMNANVFNYQALSNKLSVQSTVLHTRQAGETAAYCAYSSLYNPTSLGEMRGADLSARVLNEEWFGVEYRLKMSNPHGTATGEIEAWIYDRSGTVVGHHLLSNAITFKDGITAFDHGWNKFVWGGNRYDGQSYCGTGIVGCQFGPVEHYYIDDVIIDNNRIGPTYFSLIDSPIIQKISGN